MTSQVHTLIITFYLHLTDKAQKLTYHGTKVTTTFLENVETYEVLEQ